MNRLIGRKREYERLTKCMENTQAQLIVVYGRRRVGKTYLVNQFFEGRFDFKFTGAYDTPRDLQLRNFSIELSLQTGKEIPVPKDWTDAFYALRVYLSSLPQGEKKIVFFDEMPWMDTPKSGFLPAFEWFWNSWGSSVENLVFIVCGSATSWLAKHIGENKGGLFNRVTCRLYLNPFTLNETEEYLKSKNIEWSRYDIAECYMVMGGIPYYLSLLEPQLSVSQNIDNLFFRKRSELWDEFIHLYQTLFQNSEQCIKLTEALSRKMYGLTRSELTELPGISQNGVLTKILTDLVDSGFVRENKCFTKNKRDIRYQLSDYYSLFYYRFIKGNRQRDEHFWVNTLDLPAKRAWLGMTFEQLCKDHIVEIKQKLGIAGVYSEEYVWFYQGDRDAEETGAQIDLVIERRDRTINICEMKYSLRPYEIDKEYAQKLRTKVDLFREKTNTTNTLNLTMITTFGVKSNKYSRMVTSEVTIDDLFA